MTSDLGPRIRDKLNDRMNIHGWDVVRRVVGLILMAAAALKVASLASGTVDPSLPFASSRVQAASAEYEMLLGTWLLWGVFPRLVWGISVSTFGVLAGISLHLLLDHRPSCGCFGSVAVSPWDSFALDLLAIAVLVWWRPENESSRSMISVRSLANPVRTLLSFLVGAMVLSLPVIASLHWIHRSPTAALAILRGEPLVIEPALSVVENLLSGESRTFRVMVQNLSDRSFRIIGGTSDCSCISTADLPLVVPPRGTAALSIQLNLRGRAGTYRRSFLLRTDEQTQPEVIARIEAHLIEPPSESF